MPVLSEELRASGLVEATLGQALRQDASIRTEGRVTVGEESSVMNPSALIVAIDVYVVIINGHSCSLALQVLVSCCRLRYTFSYITSFSIS